MGFNSPAQARGGQIIAGPVSFIGAGGPFNINVPAGVTAIKVIAPKLVSCTVTGLVSGISYPVSVGSSTAICVFGAGVDDQLEINVLTGLMAGAFAYVLSAPDTVELAGGPAEAFQAVANWDGGPYPGPNFGLAGMIGGVGPAAIGTPETSPILATDNGPNMVTVDWGGALRVAIVPPAGVHGGAPYNDLLHTQIYGGAATATLLGAPAARMRYRIFNAEVGFVQGASGVDAYITDSVANSFCYASQGSNVASHWGVAGLPLATAAGLTVNVPHPNGAVSMWAEVAFTLETV